MPSVALRRPHLRRAELRVGAAAAGALLLVAALATLRPAEAPAPPSTMLAHRVATAEVGLAVPFAWLATALPGAGLDDQVDLIGVRRGELASVYPLARGARIIALEDRAVVLGMDAEDAAQVALARVNDLLIVPVLRPRR